MSGSNQPRSRKGREVFWGGAPSRTPSELEKSKTFAAFAASRWKLALPVAPKKREGVGEPALPLRLRRSATPPLARVPPGAPRFRFFHVPLVDCGGPYGKTPASRAVAAPRRTGRCFATHTFLTYDRA